MRSSLREGRRPVRKHRGKEGGAVVAALGPTNTGKTHRALERMLQHASGMIGLPLRLLAREVYDRLTVRVGEAAVALVTGEERRIPPDPAYWVCTVEAMPLGRAVEFLAVDEIQLAAHPQRGHIFTDRLLHARGAKETWFLGSPTVAPWVREFIPGAQFEAFERFSQLTHTGSSSLRGLPPRSAVVAFSAREVYSLAERLRTLRGGVAVVLGALSPRTRNAQVAMYQAGEVNHLVATDAIGMGLNLSIDHVAFSSLTKFDGRVVRPLQPDELGQIAGRAGRHVRDGTFGTLRPIEDLPNRLVHMVESHRYPTHRKLVYRNAALDFTSLAALRSSLTVPAPHPALARVQHADDSAALEHLSASEQVQRLAQDEAGVALLWEVCQVPNFRKQMDAHHAASLLPFFVQLRTAGALDKNMFARTIASLDRSEGDIDTLTDRLERIRTFSYLSHRKGWLTEAGHFQGRTQAIEERLGDALHAKLVERFVSRERPRPPRRSQAKPAQAAPRPDGPFAQLAGLQLAPGRDQNDSEDSFVARIEDAEHAAFAIDGLGRIHFETEAIGRLVAGKHQRAPGAALHQPDLFTGGAGRRVLRRLRALTLDVVAEAGGGHAQLQPMFASPQGRGLAYVLEMGLGVAARKDVEALHRRLSKAERQRFEELGLRLGRKLVWLQGAVAGPALARRWLLAQLLDRSMGSFADADDATPDFAHAEQALRFGYVWLRKREAYRLDRWVRYERYAEVVRGSDKGAPLTASEDATLTAQEAGTRLLRELTLAAGPLKSPRERLHATLKALGLRQDPSLGVVALRARRRGTRRRPTATAGAGPQVPNAPQEPNAPDPPTEPSGATTGDRN